MCGIIGFIGKGDGVDNVLDGLTKLEYRGYDSAGLAFLQDEKIKSITCVGHVEQLIKKTKELNPPKDCNLAIGHSRWATHGGVTETNAHPHLSNNGEFAVVHNGIIENYLEIIEYLKEHGFTMHSETDTEVIPNLIQHYYKGDIHKAIQKTVKRLKGSYAIAVLSLKDPNILICTKRDMPLCLGAGEDFYYVSSDIPTAITKAADIYIIENDDMAIISTDGIEFWNDGIQIKKQAIKHSKNRQLITKGEFSTYMEKEINDIPNVFQTLISHYCNTEDNPITPKLLNLLRKASTIHICACGTAYHAGLTLGALIETHCKVRVKNHIASEFRYNSPLLFPKDIGIIISQSGETADTIAAMHLLRENKIPVIAICNTDNSTIAREADYYLPTLAGFEIAVASTKAYCAQVLLGAILANAQSGNKIFTKEAFSLLPMQAHMIIAKNKDIAALAAKYKDIARIFFLGKGLDSFTTLEAALKVKEITYMQCEGYPAGELKHGTLSLVDHDTLTGVFNTGGEILESKTANAAAEVKARGSRIWNIEVPESSLSFCCTVIPVQLFALHMCKLKGHNPDKPRNLAKAVTVE